MNDSLRPAQQRALAYEGGPLAISAVPGAGKTFILTRLAVRLVKDLGVRPRQILILTYMRSAAATFRTRINQALTAEGITAYGLQAMTIHAFCLGVIKRYRGSQREVASEDSLLGSEPFQVLSEPEQKRILLAGLKAFGQDRAAFAAWRERRAGADGDRGAKKDLETLFYETADTALRVIGAAKAFRLSTDQVDALLGTTQPELAFLYRFYLARQQAERLVDFNDQVQQAIALLRRDPALLSWYQRRYAYILEDEAQDSTAAQHELLTLLTAPDHGGAGNLVRVGDSNQSITTTFTFNDPEYFRDFCRRLEPQGRHVVMDQSSRSAPEILTLANSLVTFAAEHPHPDIRRAFVTHLIQPVTEGQVRNPTLLAAPSWTMYDNPDDERLSILRAAGSFLAADPDAHAAILVCRNKDVADYAADARRLGIPLFEGGLATLKSQDVLAVLVELAHFLAAPGDHANRRFQRLVELSQRHQQEAWADPKTALAFLHEASMPDLVYPAYNLAPPRPVALSERDYATMLDVADVVRLCFDSRHLPPEDALPQVALAFFSDPLAPLIAATAVKAARRTLSRSTTESGNPWAGFAREFETLSHLAERRELVVAEGTLAVPQTGELQVLTLHGSKGAEYDAVWIPGMGYGERSSSSWFPWMPADTYVMDVEGLKAERALRLGPDTALPPESMLVEEAKAAAIAERLRLLYVGITRAQRALHLSAHRSIRRQDSLPRHIAYLAALCQPREAVR